MNSSILLNGADKSRLEQITRSKSPPLSQLLASARVSEQNDLLETRVGLRDLVTLISTTDAEDYYKFRIVLPDEADVDADLISVMVPISLSTLGRGFGEKVSWTTAAGDRLMRIISIHKHQDDVPGAGDVVASPHGMASAR